MINYTNNYIQAKKSYNQLNIEKIPNPSYQSKQRSLSYNIDKIKSNATTKKINNPINKSISVNKQIQYQKKNLSKNSENVFYSSYNGISFLKVNNNNIKNKYIKTYINVNNNTNPKPERNMQTNNYSNNKLRRKMILSVDINNNKKSIKNMSQYDLSNNIKFITDIQSDNYNNSKNTENNPSNPMSNGAKDTPNNINNNIINNKIKQNSASITHIAKNWSQNNLMKSPIKKYNSNALNKYIEISDKKERNSKNSNTNNNNTNNNINTNLKKVNITIKPSYGLLEHHNNYQNNNTTGNIEKKYIKPNLKNSNTTYYKLNNTNHNSKYNIYDNNSNNYKIMKEIAEIQTDMEKKLKENVTNSKSKKYNTFKHAFETLIKYLGNTIFKNSNITINHLLQKILYGYHEVVNAFSTENKKLKQINYNLNEQYENMSKVLFDLNKKYKEKQKLIENLQKKINILEKGFNKKNIVQNQKNNTSKNINIINIGDKYVNKNEQNKKIFELNKQNLEDLDALYFYDKIKEGKKRAISIPKIEIKQQVEENDEEDEGEEYENDEMNRTVAFSYILGLFISSGDIKFTSKTFIKIKKAFQL